MKKRKLVLVFCMAILLLPIMHAQAEAVAGEDNAAPDYVDPDLWITPFSAVHAVDVFYVYPTVSNNESGNMDVTSPEERTLAQGICAAQASVFEGAANLYAPYYRQMSTGAAISDDPNALATDLPEFKMGAADVKAAFQYYIGHLNQGRPFILAGHSQGTMALIELIKTEFGNNETLGNQLVAAYLIGYTVTDDDLAAAGLTAAQGETDTGVVITYNTQSVTSAGGPMLMEGANCINPLNWMTDGTPAQASENLGAVFFNDSTGEFLREVPAYCGATIDAQTGALTTTISEELEIGPYPEGVYHRYDYAFWYRNLQENIRLRIEAYVTRLEDSAT